MSAICEMTIFPMDKGESVSSHVASIVETISESGLEFEIGPMGTSFEGDIEQVMSLSTMCLQQMAEESKRVYMVIKIDYRAGKSGRMTSKVESVKEKIS